MLTVVKGRVRRLWGRYRKKTWVLVGVGSMALLLLGGGAYAALGGTFQQQSSSDIELQRGLVGWWKLDGNAKDATPYHNNGTVSGATLVPDRENTASSAYSFDGSTNYITTNLTGFPMGSADRSVFAWVYRTAYPAGSWSMVDTYGTAVSAQASALSITNAGNVAFNSQSNDFVSTLTLPLNGWHLIGYTVTGGNMVTVWCDGQSQAKTLTSTLNTTGTTHNIGRWTSGDYWGGSIDDVRVYNRAISSNEIQALYKQYNPGVQAASGDKGLVGWWKFDGNANDSTPNRDNGTVTGATPANDRKGTANGAYNFSGSTQYITIPAEAALRPPSQMTLEAWVNTGALNSTGEQKIVSTTESGGYTLYMTGSSADICAANQIGFSINIAGSYKGACVNKTAMSDGVWTHLAGTYDGTNVRLFINGSEIATTAATGAIHYSYTNIPLCISAEANGSSCGTQYVTGLIDDVRVYGRALTASELQTQIASYNSQINLNSNPTNTVSTGNLNQGLVGYWKFNGNANDSTPYRINGTVNGATPTTDRFGRSNSAYLLGNSAAWINVGSPSLYANLTTSGFTYTIWLSRGSASTAQWPEIMGASNTHLYYGIRSQNFGNNITFEYANGTFDGSHFTSMGFSGCSTAAIGSWHMFTVTYSGTTLTGYCDGNQVATTTATLNPTFGGLSFTSSGSGWVGSIDQARVYNRALTGTEVQTLYQSKD